MDNQSLQRIKDLIGKSQNMVIAVGSNPTIDEMAAALSLSLAFEAVNKHNTVICPTDPIVELTNLVGIDRVQKSLSSGATGGDLIVSFPYQEGEIEKVSYTIDNGYLNIVVKAAENGLSFTEKDVKYSHGGGSGTADLLFIVGTPRLEDVSGLLSPEVMQTVPIINIDNKEENQGFGNMVLVSPRFSSVSEQIADLLLSLGLDFDQDVAQNMMIGMSAATNNFQDPKTSYVAFEIASILMKKGARRLQVAGGAMNARPFDQQAANPFAPQQANQSMFGNQPQPQQRQAQPAPVSAPEPQQEENSWLNEPPREQPSWQQTQTQSQPTQQPQQDEEQRDSTNPPADWLTPKVYKGSGSLS